MDRATGSVIRRGAVLPQPLMRSQSVTVSGP